ncbi:MAG: hypothetical protein L0220_05235 [Acidobacteria bacterium]|nr:hypothetical protein [Acidobacteriota bacterium]
MRKILSAIIISAFSLSAAWLGSETFVYGQKTTEQFIPLGKSPGVSGKSTWIGTVEKVDGQNKTLTVKTDSYVKTLKVSDQTHIWLDRSKARLSNIKGGFTDLKNGRKVEVKYLKGRETEAEWIKIEVAE